MIKSIRISAALIILFSCGDASETKPVTKADSVATSHHQHALSGEDYAVQVNTGVIKEDTMKGSPVRVATGTVGKTQIQITYGSPGIKGRIIWGGLVAYDKVWATGAHKATKVNLSDAITIAGKQIPAGDYAFFTVPGKEKWVLILNKKFDQHLADEYNEADDVVRVEVIPKISDSAVQRLTYLIRPQGIVMQWEKLEVELPVTSD